MSEQLKERLFNYEVSPPPVVWETIHQELEESNTFSQLSRKMYGYEVDPPVSAWPLIARNLGEAIPELIPAPVKRMNRKVFRIAAAAVVLGVVLAGSLYIFNNISTKLQISSNKQLDNSGDTQTLPQETPTITTAPTVPEPGIARHMNTTISGTSGYKHQKKNTPGSKVLRNSIIKNVRSFGSELAILIKPKPIRNDKGYIIQNLNLMNVRGDNYISVTGPNGQQTKISAKFVNVLLYMNNDSNIEQFEGYFSKTFLESLIWKSRFQEWRNKILQTSMIPSSDNFMDILELKDLIVKDEKPQ